MSFIGAEIRPGEGVAGRAIRDRTTAIDEQYSRDRFPEGVRDAKVADPMIGHGLPLIRDGVVVGALSVTRWDLSRPFSRIEREASEVLGHQVALAVTNTFLHSDVLEASVRDPLTGLFNRRHLDASIDRFLAARRRLEPKKRQPAAVILFDLDHFGAFNKRHGHRVGDIGPARLRRPAPRALPGERPGRPLRRRGVRGGPRRAPRLDDAVRIANEVRLAWAARTFNGVDGEPLHATVSAGCARLEDNAMSAEDLFTAADVGLAMAKAAGRDLVVAA